MGIKYHVFWPTLTFIFLFGGWLYLSANAGPHDDSAVIRADIPGVVKVEAFQKLTELDPRDGMPLGASGTGWFTDENLIVTNDHVIHDADRVYIRSISSSKAYSATVVADDPVSDLALIRIDDWKGFTTINPYKILSMSPSSRVLQGQAVWAIGHPIGHDWTVSKGVLAYSDRMPPTGLPGWFIQSDLAISNGNSGGPLINGAGDVIGINSQIYVVPGGEHSFAIPSEIVQKVVGDFRSPSGKPTWPYVGFLYAPAESGEGILVKEIAGENSLEGVDLVAGDVVLDLKSRTSFGYQKIVDKELSENLATLDAGDQMTLSILRDGKILSRTVTLKGRDGSAYDAALAEQKKEEEDREDH